MGTINLNFSYLVRNQKDTTKDIKKDIKSHAPRTERFVSAWPVFAAYYVTKKTFHNTPT